MKNLVSILNESNVNESSNFDVDTFVSLWKQLFSWDKLNYQAKQIVIDYFRDSNSSDVYGQISNFDLSYKDINKSHDICREIYNAIKKIEHYSKYCGYDGTTTIHDKELNELLKILEGEENEK